MGNASRATTKQRRVVVTGLGAVTAAGLTVADLWQSVASGASAMVPITRFDTTGFPTTFAAEIQDQGISDRIGRKESRRMDRYTRYAVLATRDAVTEAEFDIAADAERVAVLIGTGFGGIESFESAIETMLTKGPRRISPFAVPMSIPNMAPGMVAIDIGAKGPVFAHLSSFASSANAIGEAARLIQRGTCDVAIAGGGEAPITPTVMAGLSAMDATSSRNSCPAQAIRPFDVTRDGCGAGEGAAVLVLEEREHAIGRDASVLAELVGYGSTADAYHLVQLPPDGDGLVRAMTSALAEASINPDQIGYINAHGTATTMNDAVETMAIKRAFGDAAYQVPISSTKAVTGHLLGAAGSLEAVIAIQAIRNGMIPPTTNLRQPSPECDLDYVAGQSRPADVRHAMSNSMGFGGHSVSLIFAHPDIVTI